MRIAYSGCFLREGFQDLGCEVVPLPLDATKTLNELVEQTGVEPDFVFMEFFGQTTLPKEFFNCRHTLVGYCIDSCLNAFWLAPLMRLFDTVYVDQLSSVSRFRRDGVQAKWLPLCASKHDFRPAAAKKHLITFVGRLTSHRVKRHNLIECISKQVPVNIVQDVSRAAMLDIFASSRIVLNENFFSGLNLRFFQVLASGALLLTERQGHGVNFHFQEGTHYVGYSPKDLAAVIERITRPGEALEPIARRGQEVCATAHTSAHRAQVVVDDLASGRSAPKLPAPDRMLGEAQGKYSHALRFGGKFDESVRLLADAASTANANLSRALHLLGSIHLRAGRVAPGVACLEACAAGWTIDGLRATLKLMLLFADKDRFLTYLAMLVTTLAKLRMHGKQYAPFIQLLQHKEDRYYNVCLLACEVLSDLKEYFDLGFHKPYEERFPDYALEYAALAFSTKMTEQSLAAIIKCTRKTGVAPEALGSIKQAILAGVASDEQIALSASLAREYYDFTYAETTLKALGATVG